MLRIGSVPYLNARPLLEGLDAVAPVRREVPSRLAGLLAAGALDVALTPVVEAFDHPEMSVVPGAAVTAHGPVESVLLFCRSEPGSARTVALDASSRTSADLVRVLPEVREVYGYFNNHWAGHSPASANEMKRRLGLAAIEAKTLWPQRELF